MYNIVWIIKKYSVCRKIVEIAHHTFEMTQKYTLATIRCCWTLFMAGQSFFKST